MNPSNNSQHGQHMKPSMELPKGPLMFNPGSISGISGNIPGLQGYMGHLNP